MGRIDLCAESTSAEALVRRQGELLDGKFWWREVEVRREGERRESKRARKGSVLPQSLSLSLSLSRAQFVGIPTTTTTANASAATTFNNATSTTHHDGEKARPPPLFRCSNARARGRSPPRRRRSRARAPKSNREPRRAIRRTDRRPRDPRLRPSPPPPTQHARPVAARPPAADAARLVFSNK